MKAHLANRLFSFFLKSLVILGIVCLTNISLTDRSQAARNSNLSADQVQIVNRINHYLNSLTNLKGSFTQVGPNGGLSQGIFYLSIPGKVRFEYKAPNPLLIVSDGRWVGIEDRSIRKTDKYPLSTTPLKFLLDNDVNLDKDAIIHSVSRGDGFVSVTLADRKRITPGQLTLIFSDAGDLSLRRWVVMDAQGLRTEVSVFDLVAGVKSRKRLFWINDNNVLDVTRGNR